MVQRVYRQIKEVGTWDSITVAASSSQRDQLELQLGEKVNIIIEPERRDTFPAIALACSYLRSEKKVNNNEIVAVLPVDPFVDVDFFYKVAEIEKVLSTDNDTELVLLGAAPTIATEKYGYIVPDFDAPEGPFKEHSVRSFKEKPSREEAADLIKLGALWNCGVFGLTIGYIFDILRDKYNIENFTFESIQNNFSMLKRTSFDYEVVEKASKIKVLKYEKTWTDLGTWQTITKEMTSRTGGNVILEGDCDQTYIVNDQDLPIVVLDVKNAIVVASNDGILVADRDETHKLKDVLGSVTRRPMYERKRWGRYKVIEHTKYPDGTEALTKKLILEPGKQLSYQYHYHRKEIWTIISGNGVMYLDGEKKSVFAGMVISIQEQQKHGIYAITDMEIIEVQLGLNLIESDIIRIDENWRP